MVREIVNPDAQAALLLTDEACKEIGIHPKALTFVHIASVLVAKPGTVPAIIVKMLSKEAYAEIKASLIHDAGLEDALPLIEKGKVSFKAFRKPISIAIRSAVKAAMNSLPDKTSYQVDEARLLDACISNSKVVAKTFEMVGWSSDFSKAIATDQQSTQTQQTIDAKTYPMLHSHGVCMTDQAAAGELDHIVGREREVDLMIQTLGRKLKRNPILVGEPGVGKTAVVEKLALMIVSRDPKIPEAMRHTVIYNVSLGSLVAGTQYRGQFEDRIKQLIDEVKSNQNIIMFIDEFHTIVGAGAAEGAV